MGICTSKGEDPGVRAHKDVEKQLKEAKLHRDAQVKILLLGSGETKLMRCGPCRVLTGRHR
jgi:hypothetical protein